jgi:hypothetical protein
VSAYREWRERVAKALGKPPLPPEVREAQRVYEQDVVEFWDDRKAGDQAAIDRNKLYESELTAAECRAGIHDGCVHEEAHDDTEYMHARSGSGEQVGVVWGTVNPDGSVTARGFTDSENYRDDSDVHPAGSLVAYHAEDNTWVHMATGQTVAKQREIDTARAEEPPVNEAAKGVVDGVSTVTPTGLATAVASSATGKDIQSPLAEQRAAHSEKRAAWAENQLAANPHATQENREWWTRMRDSHRENAQRRRAEADKPSKSTVTSGGTTTPAPSSGAATSGGSGVSYAEDGNQLIQQAGQDIDDAMGVIQEAVSKLESAAQKVTQAAQGSQHPEADTAIGALQQAATTGNDFQQQVGAAKQAVEDVRL